MSSAFLAFKRKIWQTLLLVAGLFLLVNAYATLGFVWIEKAPLLDAFYMAVITITTVGYGEVFPLSASGRLFAISSIYLGLLSSGIAIAMVTDLFVQGSLLHFFRTLFREGRMRRLKGHFIVCGYGTTGQGIVRELLAQGDTVVVIDRMAVDAKNHMFTLTGDARRDHVLHEAGISEAAGLATTLTEDADNVFVVLTARALNPTLKIVSRFKDNDTERKLEIAGVNHALSPYRIGGHRLAMALTNPPFLEVLDASFQNKAGMQVRFHHVKLPGRSRVAGKLLRDSNLRESALGALVVAVIDHSGNTIFNPSPDYYMDHADQLLVMGDDEQVNALRIYLAPLEA